MSYCRQEGKDQIVFLTKDDYNTLGDKPPILLKDEDEDEPGLILPTGEINWNCPCLGGMASGPCGVDFREAFSCFHYSKAEPKGSDCYNAFSKMQECMVQYPRLYPMNDDDDDDDQLGKALDELAKEEAKQDSADVDETGEKSGSKS